MEVQMIVAHEKDRKGVVFDHPDVKNVTMKALVSPEEGWPDYVMRIFDIEAGGHSPRHSHDWPHINYVVEGTGTVHVDGKDHSVQAGSYAYIPAGSLHQFINTGDGVFRFICIVPKHGHS
jgi:quercetin dioxygenase-like cupin family protein